MLFRSPIERTTGGDMPQFLAAFLKDRKLTSREAARIKKLIEEAEE